MNDLGISEDQSGILQVIKFRSRWRPHKRNIQCLIQVFINTVIYIYVGKRPKKTEKTIISFLD